MRATIESVGPDYLFSTGGIIVSGKGFSSTDTMLLIGGLSAPIKVVTNNEIKAEIPVVKTGIYDIRVLTRILRTNPKNEYSNPFFVHIDGITDSDVISRGGLVLDRKELPCIMVPQ